jgi:hypothetical protein
VDTQDLDGEGSIQPVEGTLEVKGVGNATAVSHLVFGVTNLRIKASGVVNFVLYIDNREISSIPLYVLKG